jgi:hypothetical protein
VAVPAWLVAGRVVSVGLGVVGGLVGCWVVGLAAPASGRGSAVRPDAHTAPAAKTTANTMPRIRCTTTERGMQIHPLARRLVAYARLSGISRPLVDWLSVRSCPILGMRIIATPFVNNVN